MGLKWDQAEELAEVLAENHPGLNPLDARFTDLRQWVIDLDEFDDDRNGSTEGKLEFHFLPGYAPELNPDELV